MSRLFWIVIAQALISIVLAEPAIDNEEVIQVTEDIPDVESMNVPPGEQKLPSPAELLKILDNMKGISDEEKENLRESLLKRMAETQEHVDEDVASASFISHFQYQILLLLGMLTLLTLIFGFFGYKLYKSLVAREIRREMKKKQKELKKKK